MKKLFVLSPSQFCNNNCIMCSEYKTDSYYEVNVNDLIKKTTPLLPQSDKDNVKVVIGGGEPTLYPYLIEIIEYIRSNGFKNIAILTNGIRLKNKELLKKIIEAGVNIFLISLHSDDKSIVSKITRNENCFDDSLQGLHNLSEFKKKYPIKINISHVIQKYNYQRLSEFVHFTSEFNFDVLSLAYADTTLKDIMVDFDTLKPYLLNGISVLQKKNIDFAINSIPPCVYVGFERYNYDINKSKVSVFGIHTTFNEISSQSIKPVRQLKDQFTYSPKCSKCVYISVCRGILNSYFREFGDRGINPVNFYEAKMVLDELKIKTLRCM